MSPSRSAPPSGQGSIILGSLSSFRSITRDAALMIPGVDRKFCWIRTVVTSAPGAERDDILIVRAPPLVDTLVVIADDGEVPSAADHQAYQLLLRVLMSWASLVDDQGIGPVPSLTGEQGGVLFERVDIMGDHPDEVDVMVCMEAVEVGAVTPAKGRVEAGRVDPFVPDQVGVPAEVVDDLAPRWLAAPVLVVDEEVLETEVPIIPGAEEGGAYRRRAGRRNDRSAEPPSAADRSRHERCRPRSRPGPVPPGPVHADEDGDDRPSLLQPGQ